MTVNRSIAWVFFMSAVGVLSWAPAPAFVQEPARRADSPTSQALPPAGVGGSWLLHLACSDGVRRGRLDVGTRTIPALLEIREGPSLNADLYVIETYAPAVRMTGGHEPGTRSVELTATEWIYRSRTVTEPPVISATLDESGLRLQGTITLRPNLAQCGSFSAAKFARDERRPAPNGLLAAFPDPRRAFDVRDEALCRDFLSWNVEGTSIETQGEEIPSQVMDADMFYRMTGKPYDQWTDHDERVFSGLLNGCWRTFQGSSRIEDTSLLEKSRKSRQLSLFLNPGVPEKPNQQRHYLYLGRYARVIALRSARLHAELRVSEAEQLAPTSENRARVAEAARVIAEGNGVFAALNRAETERYVKLLSGQEDRLVRALGALAVGQAEKDIARARTMANALGQLDALRSLFLGKTAYHATLSPADRKALESRLVDEQRAVSKRAIEPVVAQMESIRVDDATLGSIDKAAKGLEPMLALLIGGLDGEYRRRISSKREATLNELVSRRLALLSTYQDGKEGLQRSAAWADGFRNSFGAYEASNAYRNGMAKYRQLRNQLLVASLDEFESELQSTAKRSGGGSVDAILKQYLSWQGDAELPASLEYSILAETYK
jgi:hypothetical protein